MDNILGSAVDWVKNGNAKSLKYCNGSWVRAPARGSFAICQKHLATPLTQSTALPSTVVQYYISLLINLWNSLSFFRFSKYSSIPWRWRTWGRWARCSSSSGPTLCGSYSTGAGTRSRTGRASIAREDSVQRTQFSRIVQADHSGCSLGLIDKKIQRLRLSIWSLY